MFVKVCGLHDEVAARHAVDAGADAIGLVMSPKSPRHVSMSAAASILAAVGDSVDTVLVVREMPIAHAIEVTRDLGFSVLQLHGKYSKNDFNLATAALPRVWRATSLTLSPEVYAGEYDEERLLLDGERAGSGERWELPTTVRPRLGDGWILAGGLSPVNVVSAIQTLRPWGVDVSSGVESEPGRKDPHLVAEFIRLAKS